MALTQAQQNYCYYVIGYVETRNNYSGVNQSDAITLGITQWYGQNAWRLLDAVRTGAPESYAQLSSRLRSLCEGGAQTWDYWTNIYLLDNDAQSWADAAQAEANHVVQDRLFMSDVFGGGGNYDRLVGWGLGSDPKTAIFYLSMYHQRPASASNCMGQVGGNASIDTLLQWCLADSILGSYSNRYRTVHRLLSEWDGESEPPDFGQSDVILPSDPSGSIEQGTLQSTLAYIQSYGNDLIAFGEMSTTERLICRNTGKGIWIPVDGTVPSNPGGGGPDPDPDVPPASEDDPADFPAMRQLWYDNANKWSYGQGAGRLSPETSGYSDCSACIYWAANKATNNKYSWMGTWTGAMQTNCHHIWSGGSEPLPIELMRPGDLVLVDRGSDTTTDHVEWYFGNNVLWGAGYGPLPHLSTNDARNYYQITNATRLHVYRFLD